MLELFKNKPVPAPSSEVCRKTLGDLENRKAEHGRRLGDVRASIGRLELKISEAENAISAGEDQWSALEGSRSELANLRQRGGEIQSDINALEPLIAKARARLEQAEETET